MATRAAIDPDFTYFTNEAEIKAKCNYCGIVMDASLVNDHRKICKENPKNSR
jgi:hypothetical protein